MGGLAVLVAVPVHELLVVARVGMAQQDKVIKVGIPQVVLKVEMAVAVAAVQDKLEQTRLVKVEEKVGMVLKILLLELLLIMVVVEAVVLVLPKAVLPGLEV
jgi:hypothetical protein